MKELYGMYVRMEQEEKSIPESPDRKIENKDKDDVMTQMLRNSGMQTTWK